MPGYTEKIQELRRMGWNDEYFDIEEVNSAIHRVGKGMDPPSWWDMEYHVIAPRDAEPFVPDGAIVHLVD